ncbi:hypothetical protein MTYP_00627 [Methylophilaceae bacterium]|nr:hypothetical protein MTYP_00627 [Methylophilaceae bacterium]
MADDKKADSLVDTLLAVGRLGLMMLGIVGIAVEIFRENGLLKQAFKSLFDSPTGLIMIPIGILAIYLFARWLNASPDGKATRRGDLPMYAMMGVGGFFLYRLITTGSF